MQAVADGLAQVRNDVLGSALGELAFAPGETRELREILLEQVPELTDQFLSGLTSMRDGVISAERVQETIDFVGEISALTADLPTEPDEIVDFLAQSFVGLPGSLLDAPLALTSPVLDRLEQMADAAANNNVQLQLPALSGATGRRSGPDRRYRRDGGEQLPGRYRKAHRGPDVSGSHFG